MTNETPKHKTKFTITLEKETLMTVETRGVRYFRCNLLANDSNCGSLVFKEEDFKNFKDCLFFGQLVCRKRNEEEQQQ